MTATSIYTLQKADVHQHVGRAVILQRGQGYYRADRVADLEVRDEHLHASVTGTYGNTYRVEIWCEGGEIFSTCSCLYKWGVCKHIAAALFAWLDRRADPETYSRATTVQWRAQLEAIPTPILIDQIMDEMEIDLMLERYLKRWLEKLSPKNLPKLITELFRCLRAGLPGASEHRLGRVGHILIWAESLQPDLAASVAAETIKQIQLQPDVVDHPAGTDIVRRALHILRSDVPKARMDGRSRRKLLRLLVKLAEQQRSAWQDELSDTILALADKLNERSFLIEELRKKELLAGPGLLRLLAHLYRLEGRLEEYESTRSNCLIVESDFLELFQYFLEENKPEKAMVVAEQGMERLEAAAPQLADQLTALYLEWGERELARKHLLRCFDFWPSKERLNQIEAVSREEKGWKNQHDRLRRKLE